MPPSLRQWLGSHGPRATTKTLLRVVREELARDRPLIVPEGGEQEYVPVAVPVDLLPALDEVRRKRGLIGESDGQVLARLFQTAMRVPTHEPKAPERSSPQASETVMDRLSRASREPYEEQRELAAIIDSAIQRNGLALVEAATGTGKGLVLAATAAAAATSGYRVAVAAPSHQINAQTLAHLERDLGACERAVTVYGRAQFYSPSAVFEWLDQEGGHENAEAIRQHVEADLRAFKSGARRGVFLREGLEQAAPLFPSEEVALRAGSDDEASQVYEQQFERARASRIVLMSHTMLALDLQSRRYKAFRDDPTLKGALVETEGASIAAMAVEGQLGLFDAVIVDEAHLLETNIANALSEVVPVHKTLRLLQSWAPSALAKEAGRVYRALGELDDEDSAIQLAEPGSTSSNSAAGELLKALSGVLSKAAKARTIPVEVKAVFSDYNQALKRAVDLRGASARIEFSPSFRYPQVHVGPKSVARLLALLWHGARFGVAASATLYVRDMNGLTSGRFMANRLRMSPDRLVMHTPMQPKWVTRPVVLHRTPLVAGTRKAHAWAPGAYPEDREEDYFAALGDAVAAITEGAKGGTLVLCTSYQAVRAFAQRTPPARTICAERGKPLASLLARFRQASAEGKRPVWLATGAAWTGMNIYADGESPPVERDWLLTDLVIPRLPFFATGTSTDQTRRSSMPSGLEYADRIIETSFRLQQGIGRLVRRRGLPDQSRHLWILDPRATDSSYGASLLAVLKRFESVVEIEPGRLDDAPAPLMARNAGTPKVVIDE